MERTSIPCDPETRDALRELKDESGKDWDSFLLDLAESDGSTDDNSNEFNGDLDEFKRILERIPEETAEIFARKYQ